MAHSEKRLRRLSRKLHLAKISPMIDDQSPQKNTPQKNSCRESTDEAKLNGDRKLRAL